MPSGGEHVITTRRAAVELLEQGHGAWAIAKQLKVPRNTVVRWVGHYRGFPGRHRQIPSDEGFRDPQRCLFGAVGQDLS